MTYHRIYSTCNILQEVPFKKKCPCDGSTNNVCECMIQVPPKKWVHTWDFTPLIPPPITELKIRYFHRMLRELKGTQPLLKPQLN